MRSVQKEAVMSRSRLIGAALILVVAAALSHGQAAGQGAGTDAVKAVADAYVKGSLAGDSKAIAALYADDAVEMPPNQPMVKGKAAIEDYYQKMFSSGMKVTAFTLTHLDTIAMGERAYDVGTYQQTVTPPNATTMSDSGKYAVILKRAGKDWKVVYAIYNSDQPPQAAR
jgi:uncharacterized protein (TIGR02246 family)